jgi:hypothetical protein
MFVSITAEQSTDLSNSISNDFEYEFSNTLTQSNDALVSIGNELSTSITNLAKSVQELSVDISNTITNTSENTQSIEINGGEANGISAVSVLTSINDIVQSSLANSTVVNDVITDYNNEVNQSNGTDVSGVIYLVLIIIAVVIVLGVIVKFVFYNK